MKQTHTPGPWVYHLGRGASPRFHVQTTGGYQIASTTELARHAQAFEENAAREANARLIAAAPDLLSCLKQAEQEIRLTAAIYEQEGKPETAKELRIHAAIYAKTIAKAEGNANP